MTWTCTVSVSFSPKKSKSCQIHLTFMAVSWHFHIQALPGYSLPKSIGKVIQKVGVGCRFVFLPNFSFIFGNMSDSCRFHGPFMALSSFWFLLFFGVGCRFGFFCLIWASFLAICQIHVGFMALSWHFLPSDFYCFFRKIQTNNWIHLKNDRLASMSDSSQIHRGFMALSCHSYVGFIADSCHFHGSFMALSHTSLTWVQSAKIYWKSYPKSRCWLSICFLCLISASFLAICQIHVGFMALSWRFLPSDFYCFSKQFHGTCMADSWQIHGTFMAVSWHFPGTFPFGHVWICHESAMNLPNLDETYMSDSCLFVSVYFCLFVVSVFLMLFSLMVFEVQVDQFFLGFPLIKI